MWVILLNVITASQLHSLLFEPENAPDFTHIDQFLFIQRAAQLYYPESIIKAFLSTPLTSEWTPPSITTSNQETPERQLSPNSPEFYEAYESFTPDDIMANPTTPSSSSSTDAPTPPPRTSTPSSSSSSRNFTSIPSEPTPSPSQELIAKIVQKTMQSLWHNEIVPQLARTNETMQQHLQTVQQQMDIVNRTMNDEIQRRSSTSPVMPTICPPPSAEQQDNPNIRQSDQFAIERHAVVNTDRDFMTIRPSRTTLHEEPNSFHDVTRPSKSRAVDLREFLRGTRYPILTEDDLERFGRKTLDRLTDQQITSFAEQLERFLTHDPHNYEFLAEGNALRKLMQYTRPRRLGAWLQLYVNPTIQFTFPKSQFWQKKYDENAHLCLPQPHQKPDISESIEQLTRVLATRLEPQGTPNFRINPQMNQGNNNQYSQPRNFPSNNFRNSNPNQTNYPPRNSFPRNDDNRNDFNRQSFNRNDYSRNDYPHNPQYPQNTNNRPNYSYQGQNNSPPPRNNYDNRPPHQPNQSPQQQPGQYQQQQQQSRPYQQQQQQSRPYQQQQQQPYQQQSQPFQQRPNNYDHRNQQPRNNETRPQNFERRNN